MQRMVIFVILAPIFFTLECFSKVDPPNYNFELDSLNKYFPDQTLNAAGDHEVLSKEQVRFSIKQTRYVFPLIAGVKDEVITDFIARLPQYFSHDLFHQALINRYGKQDTYLKKDETAIYQWKNKNGLRHIYVGACTITCFPIYYAVYKEGADKKDPKPVVLQTMRE